MSAYDYYLIVPFHCYFFLSNELLCLEINFHAETKGAHGRCLTEYLAGYGHFRIILLPFRPSQQVAAGEIDTDFIQQDFIGPVMRQGKPERQVL